MPSFTNREGSRIEYATEQELLDFANKVREAGGANVLEAFMPSTPQDSSACLIANALNFNCSVQPGAKALDDFLKYGEEIWLMQLPANMSKKRAQQIADAVGCRLQVDREWTGTIKENGEHRYRNRYGVILPRKIGNAADAFDEAHRGWVVKYRDSEPKRF